MRENKQHHLAIRIQLIGRVIGLVTAGFSLIFLIAEANDGAANEYVTADIVADLLLAILLVIVLTGYIFSWWREGTSAALLVMVVIGLGIHICVYAGRNHLLAWSIVGLPYLTAGGLLFYAWWLGSKLAS